MVHPRNLWFDTLEEQLAHFSNSILEDEALDDFDLVALHEFCVARTDMIQVRAGSSWIIPNRLAEPYSERLEIAETNGLITYEEELELRRADIVARGYSRQNLKTPIWFVAELSIAITPGDIRRARKRADILSRALSQSEIVIPLAYGIRVSDEIRILAEEYAVRIALQPPPPPPSEEEDYT